MTLELPALDKYIWICEQLSKHGKFNLHDYCNRFHDDRYGKTKFPARDATDFIDRLLDSTELNLTNVIKPESNRVAFKEREYVLSPGFAVENFKFPDSEMLMKAIVNKISCTTSINPFFNRLSKTVINDKIKADSDLCDKIIYKFTEYEECNHELLSKISKILNAFIENRRLRLTYMLPNESAAKRNPTAKVIPLRLVNYNGQWYLYGISSYDSKSKYYKLSRILKLDIIDRHDKKLLSDFDEAVLNQNFGIGTGGESLVAVIKFTGWASQAISTIKWNENQELTLCERDNSRIMTIRYPEYFKNELLGKVLQYGAEAEILEPEDLLNNWKNKIIAMYQKIVPPEKK